MMVMTMMMMMAMKMFVIVIALHCMARIRFQSSNPGIDAVMKHFLKYFIVTFVYFVSVGHLVV